MKLLNWVIFFLIFKQRTHLAILAWDGRRLWLIQFLLLVEIALPASDSTPPFFVVIWSHKEQLMLPQPGSFKATKGLFLMDYIFFLDRAAPLNRQNCDFPRKYENFSLLQLIVLLKFRAA